MQTLPATVLVIFGGMGDLTWRKLAPAVYNLHFDGQLPEHFAIIGLDRVQVTAEEFRNRLRDGIHRFSRRKKTDEKEWQSIAQELAYLSGDFADTSTYKGLAKILKDQEKSWGCPASIVFYLATPPGLVETVRRKGWERQAWLAAGKMSVLWQKNHLATIWHQLPR